MKTWLDTLVLKVKRSLKRRTLDGSNETFGAIRAKQIDVIARLTPFMMVVSAINSSLVLFVFFDNGHNLFLVIWALIIPFMLWTGTKAWCAQRKGRKPEVSSHRGIRRATFNALIMGCTWGLLPPVLFGDASSSQQVFLTCLMAGMLCGCGFALATIPRASFAAVLPIAAGSMISLLLEGSIIFLTSSLLVAIYTVSVLLTAVTLGRLFVSQIISQNQVEKQREIIHLLLRNFEENSSDWLWETDCDGKLKQISDRMTVVLAQSFSRLHNLSLIDALSMSNIPLIRADQDLLEGLEGVLARSEPFRDYVVVAYINGQKRWLSLTGNPNVNASGEIVGYRGVGSDVTAEKHSEAQLAHLANHDSLTGLANRAKFCNVLQNFLSKKYECGRNIGVISLDLDQFKLINDTRGHPFGDALLRAVAHRLNQCVGEHDVVARLGGDEFAIVQHAPCPTIESIKLARALLDAFSAPFNIEGSTISVKASVGMCLAPKHGNDVDTILKNVDLALFKSKDNGRGQYCMFEPEMDKYLQQVQKLELDVKLALANDEFHLEYQPLVCVQSNNVCGFEALMRWRHPERGIIGPAEFIPIAERTGIIGELGEWAIRKACATAIQWPGDIAIAVNLSPLQFHDGNIVDIIQKCLIDTGIAPERLELEITEGLLIRNTEEVLVQLHALKQLGVTISMDDFGTGYSSLSYLWRFPFDKIKIDRSFVTALGKDQSVEEILRAIVALAKLLKVHVVSEGVETIEQVKFLTEIGSDQLQGFHFGRPIPESDLPVKLLKHHLSHEIMPPATRDIAEQSAIQASVPQMARQIGTAG